jgi:hypothetical protein
MKTSGLSWVSVALLAIGLVIGKAIDNVQGPRVPESDERAATSVVGDSTGDALLGRSFVGVDLIETREDIIYRLFDAPRAPFFDMGTNRLGRILAREKIDEVLKRDFATWPMAYATPGPQAGGHLDSGGPSDTSSTTPGWRGLTPYPYGVPITTDGSDISPEFVLSDSSQIHPRDSTVEDSFPRVWLPRETDLRAPYVTRLVSVEWGRSIIDSLVYRRVKGIDRYEHIRLCTLPAGHARHYEPITAPIEVLVFLGGSGCYRAKPDIWTIHRGDTVDWTNYVGCEYYTAGQPRTLVFYPSRGETVNARRTWRR